MSFLVLSSRVIVWLIYSRLQSKAKEAMKRIAALQKPKQVCLSWISLQSLMNLSWISLMNLSQISHVSLTNLSWISHKQINKKSQTTNEQFEEPAFDAGELLEMDGFGDYDNVLLQTDLDNEEENQHKLEQTSIQNSLMQSFWSGWTTFIFFFLTQLHLARLTSYLNNGTWSKIWRTLN